MPEYDEANFYGIENLKITNLFNFGTDEIDALKIKKKVEVDCLR